MRQPTWPREKLFALGPAALSEAELWQCILGIGRVGRSVQHIARLLVSLTPSTLGSTPTPLSLPGWLGGAHSARVQAVCELALRWRNQSEVSLTSPENVLSWCQNLRTARTERIQVLYCGLRGDVLRSEVVAIGGLSTASISPKELFRPIVGLPVDSLVVCHNHPSGSLQPSAEDVVFTAKVEAACRILGYTLRDHLIVTKTAYYSFREAGKLQELSEF